MTRKNDRQRNTMESEKVMARWIPENNRPKSSIWLCSECGNRAYYIVGNARKKQKPETIPYRFCPNCGERMSGRKLIDGGEICEQI